jgi:uncharacterized DUF497 family protein
MKIRWVTISERVEDKIIMEHGVTFEDAESVLLGNPLISKAKGDRYMAIGLDRRSRYVTVIFKYTKGEARIITAYPSSDWQIKLFKRRKRR